MTMGLQHVADAGQGLELEAELFDRVEHGAVLWTARTQGIVCPSSYRRNRKLRDQATVPGLEGWPIVIRPTGGGAVPQGPGILNLAIAYTVGAGHTIHDGYALITDILRDGLSILRTDMSLGETPQSFCDGAWNLSVDGRKLAGTAQRWRPLGNGRVRILAHALVLVDGDISGPAQAVARLHHYLGLPAVRPEAHVTLREIKGADMDLQDIASSLHRSTRAKLGDDDRFRVAA